MRRIVPAMACLLIASVQPVSIFADEQVEPRLLITEQILDELVTGIVGRDVSDARKLADSELDLWMKKIDRWIELTPLQKEKLKLAARGDGVRWSLQYENLKREVVGFAVTRDEWHDLRLRAGRLRQDDVHRAGELLAVKLLGSILTAEQTARLDAIERAQFWNENRVWIVEVLTAVERRTTLEPDERSRLRELLVDHLKPQTLGAASFATWSELDFWTAFARIPDSAFESVVGKSGWSRIAAEVERYRSRGLKHLPIKAVLRAE